MKHKKIAPHTVTYCDPHKDVRLLQHVNFVMKSGAVYKDETHKQ